MIKGLSEMEALFFYFFFKKALQIRKDYLYLKKQTNKK